MTGYILNFLRKANESFCKKRINLLIPDLEIFAEKIKSCGISYSDCNELYKKIIKYKPKFVLECGSGLSTFIIGKALQENFKKKNIKGVCISMEEIEIFHNDIKENFPKDLRDYCQFIRSDVIEKKFLFFSGVGYKDIPNYDYDFVYIDGPNNLDKKDGIRKFNFDLITARIISNSKKINGLIDQRLSTVYIYKLIFGKKIKYNIIKRIGIINDIKKINNTKKWEKFNFKFNYLNNELDFKLKNTLKD